MSTPQLYETPPPLKKSYYERFGKILLASMPIGLLVCFLGSAVFTYMTPKIFESTAEVHVSHKSNNSEKNAHANSYFINDFQNLQREEIFTTVIEKLDLVSRWGMPDHEIRNNLQKSISVNLVKGTDLAVISVKLTGPVDARDIAKAYYDACKNYDPSEVELQEMESIFKDKSEDVKTLKQLVEDLEKTHVDAPPELETEKTKALANYHALSRAEDLDERLEIALAISEKNIVQVIHAQYVKEQQAHRNSRDASQDQMFEDKQALLYVHMVNMLNWYQKSLQDRAKGDNKPEYFNRARQQELEYAKAELLQKEQAAQIMNHAVTKNKTLLAEAAFTIELKEAPEVPQYPISPIVDLNLQLGAMSGVTLFPLLVLLVTSIYHRIFPARIETI